ncbi:MAG: GumC family protein [Cyclobacteriaceae bacterium]
MQTHAQTPEGIDFEKLRSVVRRNLPWIIAIFLVTNLAAYLTIRWTKDVYESESELKLEIKQDATELGIKNFVEDQNLNIISGEIEQIKSKVFLNRVVDSLDLAIGYYSIGKVLVDEKFRYAPFEVSYRTVPAWAYDRPFYFNFVDDVHYTVREKEDGTEHQGTFGEPLTIQDFTLLVRKTFAYDASSSEDYYFIIHSRKSLVEYLANNLTVEPLNFNANTIRISFQDFNALKAYVIVNAIDSLYISYSNEQKNLANKQKIEWLNKELQQIESRMEDFENYFEEFTLQNKSSSVDEDLKRTIFLINKIDSQRYDLNKKLTDLDQLINGLNEQEGRLSVPPRSVLPDYLDKQYAELQKATQERDKLALAYNENTFAFRQKENEVARLRDQFFKQLTALKQQWLENGAELTKQKRRLEEEFATMPDKNTQYSKKQRFYKLYEEFYLSLMQAKSEFEIAQAGNTPDFKVLSSATLPTTPISPKKMMIVGIGLVTSLTLNFFFIGLLYLFNNKITSLQEVERHVSVPVLGSIPSLGSDSDGLLVNDQPKSMVSEAIRTLRTNLDFFASSNHHKTIAITSTISGEGKSFLAKNLGGVLAMSTKKVLLVDLDMRKNKPNGTFSSNDASRGLSTILINKHKWIECITKTHIDNLDFIHAGPHPPNPSELLMNGPFSMLLSELNKAYDFVVIDTPPVGLVTDGIMAMKLADVSIYLFRANYSRRDAMDSLDRLHKINKIDNLAVVVNAVPVSGKAYGYGYYEERPEGRWKKAFK